jgi:hypothetical protein
VNRQDFAAQLLVVGIARCTANEVGWSTHAGDRPPSRKRKLLPVLADVPLRSECSSGSFLPNSDDERRLTGDASQNASPGSPCPDLKTGQSSTGKVDGAKICAALSDRFWE